MTSPDDATPRERATALQQLSERDLLERWITSKDQAAATELYQRYVARLLRQAEINRSQQAYIEESACLSAFGSVLRRAGEMNFYFDRDDWLWRLLATIAKRKRIARYRRQKELTGGDGLSELAVFAEGEPTPEEVATFNDLRRELWQSLKQNERIYLEMREQGFLQKEIAEKMDLDPRQVRRIARAVEVKAGKLFPDERPPNLFPDEAPAE
jgi:DNA-directed RNA polymerase specialized sigma24 family protein